MFYYFQAGTFLHNKRSSSKCLSQVKSTSAHKNKLTLWWCCHWESCPLLGRMGCVFIFKSMNQHTLMFILAAFCSLYSHIDLSLAIVWWSGWQLASCLFLYLSLAPWTDTVSVTCGISGPLRLNRAGWADVRTACCISHQRLSSAELLNETHLDCVDSLNRHKIYTT